MYVLPSLWSVKRTRQRRSAAVVKKKESEHAIFWLNHLIPSTVVDGTFKVSFDNTTLWNTYK